MVLRERKRKEMKSTNGMKTMPSTKKKKRKILQVPAKKIVMNPEGLGKCRGEKPS